MLDEGCGRPREDASSAPPPAGNGRKRSAPNKGGRNVAKFILTMGTLETNVLECFSKCLDEGAKKRRWEDTNQGWGRKRRRGDTQSWGTRSVRVAQKRRALTRYATNLTLRHKLQSSNTGAPGTISLLDPVTQELRPLTDFTGVCCGEVHGDRIHGKKTKDLMWCLHCWEHDKVRRWLCNECRRTDVSILEWKLEGICRHCPALQRVQGGRTPRKVLSDACDPEESAKMRRKAKKLKYYTSKKSLKETDKCTWRAGLGRKFGGGTAHGKHAPFLGQAHMAINQVVSERRSTTAP